MPDYTKDKIDHPLFDWVSPHSNGVFVASFKVPYDKPPAKLVRKALEFEAEINANLQKELREWRGGIVVHHPTGRDRWERMPEEQIKSAREALLKRFPNGRILNEWHSTGPGYSFQFIKKEKR